MHDPDSAQFEDYRTNYAREIKPGSYQVQVRLRAKNGFNAMRLMTMDCRVTDDGNHIYATSTKELH